LIVIGRKKATLTDYLILRVVYEQNTAKGLESLRFKSFCCVLFV